MQSRDGGGPPVRENKRFPFAMPLSADSPYLIDASGFAGTAERVLIPSGEQEVCEVVREAAASGTPLTIAGAGTGLTGGRVPQGGWVISMERLNSIQVQPGSAVC